METLFAKLNRYFCAGWRLAVLDPERGRWIVPPTPGHIGYLKAQNACGNHILMQPVQDGTYLLADDLSWPLIRRHHRFADGAWKPGRMVVETSTQNYQVWIRWPRFLSLTEKRYWLRKLLSDPGADPNQRWGRCPGFRNRKAKYRSPEGGYPLARLIWIDWKQSAVIPFMHISNPQHPMLAPPPQRGGVCHLKPLSRTQYDRGDDSATDFAYALAMARTGHSDQAIRERLLNERPCWKNHQGVKRQQNYLDRTIRRVRHVIQYSTSHP
jgi:hypothetical protein